VVDRSADLTNGLVARLLAGERVASEEGYSTEGRRSTPVLGEWLAEDE
jgi:hypothetical protein